MEKGRHDDMRRDKEGWKRRERETKTTEKERSKKNRTTKDEDGEKRDMSYFNALIFISFIYTTFIP